MSFLSPFISDALEQAASLLGIGMPSVKLLLGSLSVAIVCPFSSLGYCLFNLFNGGCN